jgi:hypothetical protein
MEISQVRPSSTGAAPSAGTVPAVPVPAAEAVPAPAAADTVELSAGASAAGTAAPAPASAIKSLTYGALGLQSPAEEKKQTDGFYTAGRYLAAAATAGAFLSLLL